MNQEYSYFSGNILGYHIFGSDEKDYNVISVYSPHWAIPKDRLSEVDVSNVKLQQNSKVYCTEILWALLKTRLPSENENWIIGGDFNTSAKFDGAWGSGNQEVIDRLKDLGLIDCISHCHKDFIPTFKNAGSGEIVHQLDYLYVNQPLLSFLKSSDAMKQENVFERNLSDHLPVVTVFC